MKSKKLNITIAPCQAFATLILTLTSAISINSWACQQVPGALPAQHFYLDLATGQTNRVSTSQENITVTGCQGARGSELQLRLGSYARLPWESSYHGFVADIGNGGIIGILQLPDLSTAEANSLAANQCSLTSEVPLRLPNYNPKLKIQAEKQALNACIEFKIKNLSQGKVIMAQSPQCAVEIVSPTEVVARGEGCSIAQPYGAYDITPQIAKGCARSDELKKIKFQDLDGRFIARFVTEDKVQGNSVDLITSQSWRLKLTDSSNTQMTKAPIKGLKNPMETPANYSANYHFSQLKLSGVPEIKVMAQLTNLITNNSDVICTQQGCSGTAQQRVPVTLENTIVLKKQNGAVIILKTWQQNLIAQAQWYGLEGPTSGDYSLTGGNPEVELSSEIKTIEVGDSIVVITNLMQPNDGINMLAAALRTNSAKSKSSLQSTVTAASSGGAFNLGTLPTLETLTLQSLPELALGSSPAKTSKKRPAWAYDFEKYCASSNETDCVSMSDDRSASPLNQTLTELKVTSLDTGIKADVVRTVKLSQLAGLRYDVKIKNGIQFNCK